MIVNDMFVEDSAECPVQRHDINTLMMLRLLREPDFLERQTLHSASTGLTSAGGW